MKATTLKEAERFFLNNSTQDKHVTGNLDMDAVAKSLEDARGKAEGFLNDEL